MSDCKNLFESQTMTEPNRTEPASPADEIVPFLCNKTSVKRKDSSSGQIYAKIITFYYKMSQSMPVPIYISVATDLIGYSG